MIRGFYSAASGMVSQQTSLNAIANNLANVNTTGFKAQQSNFASLLYENINGGTDRDISTGHGVRISELAVDFKQGDPETTGQPYDFAIQGDGFFAVKNEASGEVTYTRDGNFQIGAEGSNYYLKDAAGNYVLNSSGNKIQLEKKTATVNGKTTSTNDWDFDSSKIGVYQFANSYGLELRSGNRFAATAASGTAQSVKEPKIMSGYLEASSVDVSSEMVKMIEASKAFGFCSKVISTADDMEKVINQLR